MSEKYSGTLSQETGFRVCVKMKNGHMQAEQRFIFLQISVGITEVYFLYPFLWKTGIKRGLKRLRNDIFCRITCKKIIHLIKEETK